MNDKALPTEPGTVIGWSTTYDGTKHYGSATLDLDPDDGTLHWYLAGNSKSRTPDNLLDMIHDHWTLVGRINYPDSVS